MKRFLLSAIAVAFVWFGAGAQEFMSNSDLLTVKEKSEEIRMGWLKMFDAAAENGAFSKLAPIRQMAEGYLDQQTPRIRKLFSEGDGRALLTAVFNYIQIEKQFARDIMTPAESLAKENTEEIAKLNQRITEFGQKEKMFALEVNNAILTSPEPIAPVDRQMMTDEADENEDDSPEAASEPKPKRKPAKEAKQEPAGRKKLPHEMADDKEGKDEEED